MLNKLTRDCTASSTVDFAFALPVLTTLMLGMLQMGQILHTSGAMRHALGEGIRLAKVDPAATQTQVLDEVRDELVAIDEDGITALTFQRGTTNGARYGKIDITYRLEPMIPLVPVPAITLNESKTAYLPS